MFVYYCLVSMLFAFDLSITNISEIRINKSELPSAPQESPLKPLILPQSLWTSLGLCRVGLDEGEVGSVVGAVEEGLSGT